MERKNWTIEIFNESIGTMAFVEVKACTFIGAVMTAGEKYGRVTVDFYDPDYEPEGCEIQINGIDYFANAI